MIDFYKTTLLQVRTPTPGRSRQQAEEGVGDTGRANVPTVEDPNMGSRSAKDRSSS